MSMSQLRMNPLPIKIIRLWLALLLLAASAGAAKTLKQQNCPQCKSQSLTDVVVQANEAALKDLKVLAETAGSTVEALEDGRGYLTQLPPETIKMLSRRGIPVSPWDKPLDDPIQKDGDSCQEAIAADPNVVYTGHVTDMTPWVWYSFTPTVSGIYRISLAGSAVDTVLYVYNNCLGDPIDMDFGLGTDPELTMSMDADTTYYLLIETFWYERGDYTLFIQATDGVDVGANSENCENALVAEIGVTYMGQTTASATEQWYSFTPATSGTFQINLAGSDFDTTLSVYNECGGDQIAYNDDNGWLLTSRLVLEMEAGVTYYILINGFWGEYGQYVLLIDEYVPVPGESCLLPIEADPNTLYEGSVTETLPEVWYSFTANASGDHVISLKGSFFDTILYVYDGCGGYAVWYNDDTNDLQSRLSLFMHEGQTYSILISTWGDLGPYNLQITPATEPVPNDTVAEAAAISLASPVHGCTDAATSSLSYSSCGGYDSRDVWYAFTPASTNFMTLALQGHDFDVTLSVFDENSGTELACNDDLNDCTSESGLSMEMVQGKSYLIRVAGYYDGTGHYTLTLAPVIQSAPAAPQTPYPADGAEEIAAQVVLSWNNWTVPAATQQTRRAGARSEKSSGVELKGVYGRDDRLDEYQIEDASVRNAGDATVVLMSKSAIVRSDRRPKYMLQDETTLAEYIAQGYGAEMCPEEPFQNQPAPGFCSGFLVAPDLIVTAGHCAGCDGDMEDMVAVFNFKMTDANTPVTDFALDDVYFCQEQVVGQFGIPDWSLIRLDRPVTGHVPLRIRRSGAVAERQRLVMAGHPVGLPRKYDMGATVKDIWQKSYFSANTDSFGGNSGSAVFNRDTLEVEGILVWGNGDFDYDPTGCVLSFVCPDAGCPTWEYATRISVLSGAVPSYDVFFGNDPDNLMQVDSGWAAPQFAPEGLEPGQTYYWRIIARNAAGQTLGPIWSFTTAP